MAEQDFRNSAFYKELLSSAKEQGEVSLIDIVSVMKKHKDSAADLDAVIEALKSDGIQYTEESDESEPDFMSEPSEEDLEDFSDDEEFSDEDDASSDDAEGPSDDDLKDIEEEEEEDEENAPKKKRDEDDEDDDEDVEEEEEENINEWKGTDDDTEASSERFIDISSFSEHSAEHKTHQSSSRYDTSQDDPIRLYLKEIGNENLLTGEQEVELAMQMEKGAKIVESVIRESGILIKFFSDIIEKMNMKIEEDTEESLSTEELKEFLSIQKRYTSAYKEVLGKDIPKEIKEYLDLKGRMLLAGDAPEISKEVHEMREHLLDQLGGKPDESSPLYQGKKRSDFQSREDWLSFCRDRSREDRIRKLEEKLDGIRREEADLNAKIANEVSAKDKAYRQDHSDMKSAELEKEILRIHRSVKEEYSANEAELAKRYNDFRKEMESLENGAYIPVSDWITPIEIQQEEIDDLTDQFINARDKILLCNTKKKASEEHLKVSSTKELRQLGRDLATRSKAQAIEENLGMTADQIKEEIKELQLTEKELRTIETDFECSSEDIMAH